MQSGAALKDRACDYLRERILNCEYPPGAGISEKDVVEATGAGRTPVREALLALQSEGLVEIFPRKGTCASRITLADTMELYQLRKLIEPTVAVQYKRQINYAGLLDFEAMFREACSRPAPAREFYDMDIRFHRFIIDSTGNTRLIRMFQGLMQDTYRCGMFSSLCRHNTPAAETCEQHSRIIQAILREDDAEIEAAMTAHINSSLVSALNTLRGAEEAPGDVSDPAVVEG